MSREHMIRVDPEDVRHGEPLPFSVFTVQGALLARNGARIHEYDKVNILKRQGWRQATGDTLSDSGSSPSAWGPNAHPQQDPQVQLEIAPPAPLDQTTALIADDMELARALLTRLLNESGVARVIGANDGRQAISRFFMEKPNLVLLDIDMPHLNGLSALHQIRAWSRDVFVCLVSASSTRENLRVAREFNIDGFLVKPYSMLNMERVLARYQERLPGAGQ